MTSTGPHFALAPHPETGKWTVMQWREYRGDWLPVYTNEWHRTRAEALQHLRYQVAVYDSKVEIDLLDRLIAIERDHAAGDGARVQTITKLGGAE